MSATTVENPLRIARCQVQNLQWPVISWLLMLGLVPWLLLVAGTGSAFYKLGTFFFLHLLVTALLSGDRRIYRTLGLNRRGALRQHLVISLPVLILGGVLTLPGLSGIEWLGAPVVAVAALTVDTAITLNSVNVERRSTGVSGNPALAGPAKNGGMARRLIWVPLLRWATPLGVVLGLILAFDRDPLGSALWSLIFAGGLMAVVLTPVFEVLSGTASLATWQSLGLPRRAWSVPATVAAFLAPVLALLVALGVLGVLALWNAVAWDVVLRVASAALGIGPLWAGVSLLLISIAGHNAIFGGAAVGGMGPVLIISSGNIVHDPSASGLALAVVAAAVLLTIGLYLQHRLVDAANGGRAILDTRKFAD